MHYPRSHPSPIETCGSIADFDRSTSKLTLYMTTQAPHIIRAAVAMVAELPEHMIRVVSPDLGGGFGNKVPIYPGYVVSILASILLERPVKWIEDKTGNLISTGFARDIYLRGQLALRNDGKILGVRMHTDLITVPFFPTRSPASSRSVCCTRPLPAMTFPSHTSQPGASTRTRHRAESLTDARSALRRRCSSRNGWFRPRPTIWALIRPRSAASTSSATTISLIALPSVSSRTQASTGSAWTSGSKRSAMRTS